MIVVNLDEMALVVFFILMIVTFIFTLGTYLAIISEDMKKEDEERILEDKVRKEVKENCKKGGIN